MKALKWLVILLVVAALGLGGFLLGMRFNDGPWHLAPGGPFTTGTPTASPSDWTFLRDREEIEFQTLTPAVSRVVWVAVVDSQAYIVSGYMTTNYGKLWKQWPHYMEEDNRVILRVDGKLYEQRLERLMEHPQLAQIAATFMRKYGFEAPGDPASFIRDGHAWLYAVRPRQGAMDAMMDEAMDGRMMNGPMER